MNAHVSRFVVTGIGILSVALAGCARSAAETKAPSSSAAAEAPSVSVTPVAAVAIKVPRIVSLSGNLTGAEQAQVAAGAAGKILATYVERGSVVKKGAVLVKLDARSVGAQAEEAAAQLSSLRAQQAQALLDCQRNEQMFQKGAISK